MRTFLLFVAGILWMGLSSCDGGLTPPLLEPGISGTITVEPASSWPPRDSVQGLWLFASLQYPLDSAKVISGVLIEPRTIFLYPSLGESLPYGADTIAFRFALSPGTYRYVGVIQQLRPELLVRNFRVVAMLEDPTASGQPLTVGISQGRTIGGIHLRVNFLSPPPQPFEGAQ